MMDHGIKAGEKGGSIMGKNTPSKNKEDVPDADDVE
jgi:hypothetical protein